MTPKKRRIRMRFGAAVAVLPVAALGFAACSSSATSSSSTSASSAGSSSPSAGSSSPAATAGGSATASSLVAQAEAVIAAYSKTPTQITLTTPLPSKPPTGKTIVYLDQPTVPAVSTVGDGVRAAAQALGWNFDEIDYDPSNPASLQAAFTSALTKHPVAVSVDGTPVSLFGASTIAEYAKAGVPIIASAVAAVTPGSDGTVIGTSGNSKTDAETGTIMADWVIANSNADGDVLVVHVPGFDVLDAFVDNFKSAISACTGCKATYVNATLSDVSSDAINTIITAKLRQDPGIKYLVYDDGDWASGINSALSAAGVQSIEIGGRNATAVQMSELQTKGQAAWAEFPLAYYGYLIVDQAARHLEGAPLESNSAIMPIQLLTSSNIAGRTSYLEPSDALAQLEKLWHV